MKKYGIVITGFMKSQPLSESRCKNEENSKTGAIFASSNNGTCVINCKSINILKDSAISCRIFLSVGLSYYGSPTIV